MHALPGKTLTYRWKFNLLSAPFLQDGRSRSRRGKGDSWPLLPPVLEMGNNKGIFSREEQPASQPVSQPVSQSAGRVIHFWPAERETQGPPGGEWDGGARISTESGCSRVESSTDPLLSPVPPPFFPCRLRVTFPPLTQWAAAADGAPSSSYALCSWWVWLFLRVLPLTATGIENHFAMQVSLVLNCWLNALKVL